MSLILNLPSPTIRLDLDDHKSAKVELFVKREDLIHPTFGGNKWRKLKYNIDAFKAGGYTELITFGGPFSNHIAATAAICKAHSLPSVGIIRGNYSDPLNPTLSTARSNGMQLIHISKEAYRSKANASEVQEILAQYAKPYLVPEGGSNALALAGVKELMQEVHETRMSYDHIVVAAGTGTTAAGIIAATKGEKVTVINVLKNKDLAHAIQQHLVASSYEMGVNEDYHLGGFAKSTPELISFINKFYIEFDIALDPVYNAKAMYATMDLLSKGYFTTGSKILFIHTGGKQGIAAYNYCCKDGDQKINPELSF